MKNISFNQPITRREALKKTVIFSTGLLAAGRWTSLIAQEPVTRFAEKGMHLLALGDYGTGNANQRAVAAQMATFARKLDSPLTAVLALGDNFYGKLTPERFNERFEEMYCKESLNCPFYACLGNHDYGPDYDSGQGRDKAQMQLDYAIDNPTSRWKLPAKWYAVELPDAKNPLVKVIVLDLNTFEGSTTPQERLEQRRWLDAELAQETRAPWQWMMSHYPLFSESTKRGDSKRLIEHWGEYLRTHPFSLYLAGHDHNLQHLEVEGYNSSFVVSGAGGAGLYEVKDSTRGFARQILGFTHLHVTPGRLNVQFISSEGECLHSFQRTPAGTVTTAGL